MVSDDVPHFRQNLPDLRVNMLFQSRVQVFYGPRSYGPVQAISEFGACLDAGAHQHHQFPLVSETDLWTYCRQCTDLRIEEALICIPEWNSGFLLSAASRS